MASEIWTEKYRPSIFTELVGQADTIKRVESLTNSLNIPHLLFAGPAGTGKSSLALIIVKELFGSTWKENYLELNASDTRGIEVIRQQVKNFASEIVKGITDNLEAIDTKIAQYATNWQLKRMAVVDRNILRMSCYELMFRDDIPPKVSINEAIELAKKYSSPEAKKFVNGILDKIKSERSK